MAVAAAAVSAAVLATGATATTVAALNRRQMEELKSLAAERSHKVGDLEARAFLLESKAAEFEALPKMFSAKRREVMEASRQDIAALQAKNDEKEGQLTSIQSKLEAVPKLVSMNRRQVEALEEKARAKEAEFQQLNSKVESDLPGLQAQVEALEKKMEQMAELFDTKVQEMVQALKADAASRDAEVLALSRALETTSPTPGCCSGFSAPEAKSSTQGSCFDFLFAFRKSSS